MLPQLDLSLPHKANCYKQLTEQLYNMTAPSAVKQRAPSGPIKSNCLPDVSNFGSMARRSTRNALLQESCLDHAAAIKSIHSNLLQHAEAGVELHAYTETPDCNKAGRTVLVDWKALL